MSRLPLVVLVLVSACSSAAPAEVSSPSRDVDRTSLEATLDGIVEASDVPGAVVAIRYPDGRAELIAVGWAVRDEVPMSTAAVFGVGSVHKFLKWTAILRLVDAGVLDLDRPIGDVVDAPTVAAVTLRHLLQHTAGLPDLPEIDGFTETVIGDPTRRFAAEDVFALIPPGEADAVPGTRLRYSSIGPVVAGSLVEAVHGSSLADVVEQQVIEPLGLTSTSHVGLDPDPPRLTPGYADPTTINPFFPDATSTVAISSANGWAVHSTASDVATVVHAVFTDDGFLSPALRTQLLADPSSGGGMRSGLGVIQFDRWSDLGVWGHAGYGIRSHSALALHQLDSGVTVVVLTNLNTDLDDYATNEAIVRAVLEDAAGAR